MAEREDEVIFHVAITGPKGLRQYEVRVVRPSGARASDFHEHAMNVMGAAIEMGFALLDAAFRRSDHSTDHRV